MTRPTLEALAAVIQGKNPFAVNRIVVGDESLVDVEHIHASAFSRLTASIEEARMRRTALGIALLGDVGVGKSHLIGRLTRWAADHGVTLAKLHNVMASPARMARYVLEQLVDQLGAPRERPQASALYRFAHAAFVKDREGPLGLTTEDAFRAYADEVARRTMGRPDALEVVHAWLRGDRIEREEPLPFAPLGRLREGLEDDADVEQVISDLASLAARAGEVLVLVADQVDNLDDDRIVALSSFLHALLDRAENLVVISSGVRASIESFVERGRIPEAAWDRLAERKVAVHAIKADDGRAILGARVNALLHPFFQVPEVEARRLANPLFPLRIADFERFVTGAVDVRPRELISFGRSRWQDEAAILEAKGPYGWLESWADARSVTEPPPRAEQIGALARAALEASSPPVFGSGEWSAMVRELVADDLFGPDSTFDTRTPPKTWSEYASLLVFEQKPPAALARLAFVFSTARGGTQGYQVVKKLSQCFIAFDRLVLVTHSERAPLKTGTAGSHLMKTIISSSKFFHVKVRDEDLTSLHAMVGFLRQARAKQLRVELAGGGFDEVSLEEAISALRGMSEVMTHPMLKPFLFEDAWRFGFIDEIWRGSEEKRRSE